MRKIIIMKPTDNNTPEKENSGKNNRDRIFNEDILSQMPSVALMVQLPAAGEDNPRQLAYANRSFSKHTGYYPEALKEEGCDFFARIMHPDDLCLMTKALDHLLQNPREEYTGLVFRINAAWDECLYVICNCRVVIFDDRSLSYAICNWQVFDEHSFPEELLRSLLRVRAIKSIADKLKLITPCEKKVWELIVQGFSEKQIAEKLHISPHTVKFHRDNLEEKLGLHSIGALGYFAARYFIF
jgi:DNA-binding CsgD family transcriptional regulator